MEHNKEPIIALLRLVKSKRATNKVQLFKLIDEFYQSHHEIMSASRFGENPQPDIEEVYRYVEKWPRQWTGPLLKTGVYYVVLHFADEENLSKVFDAANMFFYEVFSQQEYMYDYIFATKRVGNKSEAHVLIQRCDYSRTTFSFKIGSYYSFANLRIILAKISNEVGIPMTV